MAKKRPAPNAPTSNVDLFNKAPKTVRAAVRTDGGPAVSALVAKAQEMFSASYVQAKRDEMVSLPENSVEREELAAELTEEKTALTAGAALDARMRVLRVPSKLTGEKAEEWADSRLTELLPLAIADLEWKLRFGSDAQKERASQRVLDATGRSKSEKNNFPTAPIITINMGGASLPWNRPPDAPVPTLSRVPAKVSLEDIIPAPSGDSDA